VKTPLILLSLLLVVYSIGCSEINSSKKGLDTESLKLQGKEISASVGKTLMGTLQGKIAANGIEGAISFCNLSALQITDSLAQVHNSIIKRTSQKFRNAQNAPDSLELQILKSYQASKIYDAQVLELKNGAVYFEPILVKGLCLNCHGKQGDNMSLQTDSIIKNYYPNDNATGFEEGDLRGMWAIYFNQ
jgi:hypothetical protein